MNILILTASTGGGHKRAAAAIEAKIRKESPETAVTVVDALKAIGKVYDKTVCGGYHFMATKVPKVYGECYKITDRKNLMYKAVMKSNTMMSKKLLESIDFYKPDVVIICHPFVTAMISRLKAKGKVNVKAISLITDYDSHRTYIASNIDAYVLAEPYMAEKLEKEYGVDKSRIYPLGIPTFDKFTASVSREEICKREGLDPNKKTVLLMAGSFGVTGVLSFYEKLAQKSDAVQLIVITGKNKRLYENMVKLIDELGTKSRTKLLYFVDNVEDYMHVSDLIVTKPGGLTVTESLACGLPLAIYSAFPGQELDNAEYLVGEEAAVLLDKKRGAEQIISLLNSPDTLEAMKKRCSQLAMPDSAEKIIKLAQKLCGKA
ncbi:MAG: glycosyltransferase [Ruminococcus sp.]|nr:glycosyltransferase [Ruminococcus sp.]